MSAPHLCPVCLGHGIVSSGFFARTADVREWSSTATTEPCRPCLGTGILWSIHVEAGALKMDKPAQTFRTPSFEDYDNWPIR